MSQRTAELVEGACSKRSDVQCILVPSCKLLPSHSLSNLVSPSTCDLTYGFAETIIICNKRNMIHGEDLIIK